VPSVVGRVGDDMTDAFQPFDEARGLRTVAPVTRCRQKPDRKAKRIDAGMYLGGQATARTPDPLSLSPPLAPVASAWALQMVLSIRTYSKSGSSDKALKMRSQTPDIAHLRKRACTLVHLPNSRGRSRHGAAVRASQSTASMNRRLSLPVLPGWSLRPSIKGSMRAYCASVKVRLLKIASVFDLESDVTQIGNPLNADRT
jgi:hypothetical protein